MGRALLACVETFVVRVAGPVEGPGGSSGLRGVVREVATGHEAVFRDGGELLAILSARLDPSTRE